MSNETLELACLLAPQIEALSQDVLTRNIGREDIVRCTLLSLVAGHPAFFLGVPGVNKTGTVQAVAKAINGTVFYEELMPAIVSPEQLVVEETTIEESTDAEGRKSICTRDRLGRAASAHLVFADEIWKAEPRVLQTLIDLSKGDGIRHEGKLVPTPLLSFLAASNELPDPEGNLGAMWSRMTIRTEVGSLSRGQKASLVKARLKRDRKSGGQTAATLQLGDIELLREARPFVTVGDDMVELVLELYQVLIDEDEQGFQWLWDDDRRFGRVFDVMQASALLDGRDTVGKIDVRVLEYLLWDTPEQIPVVKGKIAPYVRTPLGDAKELVDALLALGGNVERAKGGDRQVLVPALTQIEEAEQALAELSGEASGGEKGEIAELITELGEVKQAIAQGAIGGRR